eukprot:2067983-Pleurochrysis_carterae.AAC.2
MSVQVQWPTNAAATPAIARRNWEYVDGFASGCACACDLGKLSLAGFLAFHERIRPRRAVSRKELRSCIVRRRKIMYEYQSPHTSFLFDCNHGFGVASKGFWKLADWKVQEGTDVWNLYPSGSRVSAPN